jgi:hypothetical protein
MFIINNDSKTQYLVLTSTRWASLKLMRKDLAFWVTPEEEKRSPMVFLNKELRVTVLELL